MKDKRLNVIHRELAATEHGALPAELHARMEQCPSWNGGSRTHDTRFTVEVTVVCTAMDDMIIVER